ncbi:MAG: XrtA/PEP-CTERM system histidine kinase PrsK [Syntrophaceae bacterium]
MNYNLVIAWFAAVFTAGIAVAAFWQDRHSFVHRIFAAGMLLFALDAGLVGLFYQAPFTTQFLLRQWLQPLVASLLPAVWLLFSISFARANYKEQISQWKWVLLASLVLPVGLLAFFNNNFFVWLSIAEGGALSFIRIGWAGYVWHLIWIISSIIILMNLERTYRHATGHMRWQTKFMFLGISAVFCAHLYTDSQVLLFKAIDTELNIVGLGVLLIADLFILRSLFRGKPLNVSFHLSHQFLYGSFTITIVGIFFIFVGVFVWISLNFQWIRNFHAAIFLILMALIVVAAFFMSDRLRMQRKRFISRHFQRPQYDYQKIWESFTERTASVTRMPDLCDVNVKMVSETLDILSVSIWLVDEKQERLSFGGSTVFTKKDADTGELKFSEKSSADLIRAMSGQTMPVDLEGHKDDWVEDLKLVCGFEETKEAKIRYCVPLRTADHLIGIMTLSEKVFYQPLSFEESELMKTISNQAAAAMLNLRMAEQMRQKREMEAFQTMSSFFMHDLKNLASKLSLVTQNLPVHIDNPEFRADALRTITQSVAKINTMSSRLSLLNRKLELTCKETDLNDLVAVAVSDIKNLVRVPLSQNLGKVPPLLIDSEQMYKVVENLLINANDAVKQDGRISISTSCNENWAEIAVQDNGYGMSKEFIEKSLFLPFRTTKKQGMGIGLYHCKTIVEAHGGRVEVESEEGNGTIFHVLLPVGNN